MACEKGALEGAICARAHMRTNPNIYLIAGTWVGFNNNNNNNNIYATTTLKSTSLDGV